MPQADLKSCGKCKIEKSFDCFCKNNSTKDGLNGICKECAKTYSKDYYNKNKELLKGTQNEYHKNYRKINKESISIKQKEKRKNNLGKFRAKETAYNARNRDKRRAYLKEYRKNNPDKVIASNSRSRAIKEQRMVAWADKDLILTFYTEAKRLEKETGLKYHVDHIIPFRGEMVSGLHVHNNLQVIPAKENLMKRNKYAANIA